MTIKENLAIINQWDERYDDVKGVCVHSTWGTYQGSIQWFKNPKAQGSANYIVSKDGEISMCVPEEHTAWAQGNVTISKDKAPKIISDNWGKNPNFFLISCEMEDRRDKNWNYPSIQYQAVVELTADVCKRYKIPISRDYIVMHKEIDPLNRTDPVGQWNHDKFIEDIRLMADTIMEPQPVYAWDGAVTIRDNIHSLYVRSGPARIYNLDGSKILYPGNIVNVVEFVEGENIAYTLNGKVVESKYWWKSKLGHYFWAGGTVEQPGLKKDDDVLKSLQKEVNKMTPEEKTAKVAEFEATKIKLEARKKELEDALEVNKTDFDVYEAEFVEFNSQPVVEVPVEEVEDDPVVEEVDATEETEESPIVDEPSLKEKFDAIVEEFKEKVAGL